MSILRLSLSINTAGAALLIAVSATWVFPREAGLHAVRRARYVMGTVLEIEAHAPSAGRAREAVAAALDEVERLAGALSLYKEDSELSRLNREAARAPVSCSEDLWNVVLAGERLYRDSDGAFDMTAGSPRPGFSLVLLDAASRSVRFEGPGVRLDPGGIGKGYALDRAAGVLRRHGVTSARLNFGGQVLALGSPPGGAWTARIAGTGFTFALRDRSASTSSQAERPGHILEPNTGRSIDRPEAVTVIAANATDADAWSTALFVLGPRRTPPSFPHCAVWTDAPDVKVITAGDCRLIIEEGRE